MSNHTHEAIHQIHRPGKKGVEVIAPGEAFTPADAKQAEYLEKQSAARKRKVEKATPAADDNAGKKGGKKADKEDDLV